MRFTACIVLLLLANVAHGQTAAQRALANEPEMKKIQRAADDYQAKQSLPYNDIAKPSSGENLVRGYVGLKAQQILMDQLRERLEAEAEQCHFCAAKQDELSELLREQAATIHTYQGVFQAVDFTPAIQSFFGLDTEPQRWKDTDIPFHQAADVIGQHCDRLFPRFSSPQMRAKNTECFDETGHGPTALAADHEHKWVACFKAHDWVENSSERIAYEACMKEDPLLQLCSADNLSISAAPGCGSSVITAEDLDRLRHYSDRWVTDTKLIGVVAHTVINDPIHLTLTEPVVLPEIPAARPGSLPHADFIVKARVETGVGAVIPGGISRGIVVPAGTEIPIRVSVGGDGARATMTRVTMQLQPFQYHNPRRNTTSPVTLLAQFVTKTVPGWPLAQGTVLLPAGSSLTFQLNCECAFAMTKAQFQELVGSSAGGGSAGTSSGASGSVVKPASISNPILSGSQITTVFLEPIDVAGVQANKEFHAQLKNDMTLPPRTNRPDALILPRGTDVYLKVVDQNSGAQFGGHTAQLYADYAVFHDQKIPLQAPGPTHTFTTQVTRNPRTQGANDAVLWREGMTMGFVVPQQVDVVIASPARDAAGVSGEATASREPTSNDAGHSLIPVGTLVHMITVDPIDLDSVRAGKIFRATLTQDIVASAHDGIQTHVAVPTGASIYLRAIEDKGPQNSHEMVHITVDHVAIGDAQVPLSSADVVRNVTLPLSGNTAARSTRRVTTFGGIGISLPASGQSDASGTGQVNSNPVVLPAQFRMEVRLSQPASLPDR